MGIGPLFEDLTIDIRVKYTHVDKLTSMLTPTNQKDGNDIFILDISYICEARAKNWNTAIGHL